MTRDEMRREIARLLDVLRHTAQCLGAPLKLNPKPTDTVGFHTLRRKLVREIARAEGREG